MSNVAVVVEVFTRGLREGGCLLLEGVTNIGDCEAVSSRLRRQTPGGVDRPDIPVDIQLVAVLVRVEERRNVYSIFSTFIRYNYIYVRLVARLYLD